MIDRRDRGVGGGEAVRMNHAVAIAGVVRRDLGHVAIGAIGSFGRVVKRARALAGDSAGLPVVVVVEASDPAVVIDGLIEMDFVAGGAEFGFLHERLHEGAAVRLGIQVRDEFFSGLDQGALAGGKAMQRWIHDLEVGVAHGAANVSDGVTGDAAEAVLSLRRIDLLLDGDFEASVEEDGVIVAGGAPFAALRAAEFLHVQDAGFIELIVERGEVVHGAFPLLVNILVTFAALRGFHEEIGGHDASNAGAGGRGPEGRVRALAFLGHGGGDGGRVDDAVLGLAES